MAGVAISTATAGVLHFGSRGGLRLGWKHGRSFAGAVGAVSVEVDVVRDVGVAVLSRELAGVEFEVGGSEPDRVAAPPAHQIVAVSRGRAEAVERFAVFGALASVMFCAVRDCRMR